ncbi:MAG TPA: hypothetical protein VHT03_07880 [Rhizomicrobium sp.]|nr:hypothetical protein [Rhizomicrobium sp.]
MSAHALLLNLTLKVPLEFCQEKVDRLLSKLPGGAKVLHRQKTLAIAFLPSNLPEILIARVRPLLDDFEDWTAMEIGEWSLSKNGPGTPFETWMDDNVRPSNWREMRKSKDVTIPKWRKTGN